MYITFFCIILGFIGGFINAISGGGGLLIIPCLIYMGLNPQVAVATARLGTLGSIISFAYKFLKSGQVIWKYSIIFCLLAVTGGIIGASFVNELDAESLKKILGLTILFLSALTYFQKELGVKRKNKSPTIQLIGYCLYLFVMIFSGLSGAGAGVMVLYVLINFFGLTILQAKATDTIPWILLFASSISIFINNSSINYQLGFALVIGNLIGAYLGAHLSLTKGNKFVKSFLTLAALIMGISLFL